MKTDTTDKTPPSLLAIFLAGSFILSLTIIFFCCIAWCVQGLWNVVVPEVFYLKPLTYMQALSLTTLIQLLFGSVSLWKSKNSNK